MQEQETKLHKSLGPLHLWGIAVGLVISGDYFGWNFGWGTASFWEFALAVLLVALFYISFALSFTELSASIPHAGGPSAYAERAFGRLGGLVSGYFVFCEFALAPPAIASALGGYFHFLFPEISILSASLLFYILLVGINLLGIKQSASFELTVTFLAVFGLLLYLIASFPFFSWRNIPEWQGIGSISWKSLFSSIPFAIWFFLAVEGVSMAAEEVKNPQRDIPLGYAAGILTLILFAFSIFFVTAGVVPTSEIADSEYPLSYALGKLYGNGSLLTRIFTFIGLFGLIASLFGIILGYSRLVYALSLSGYLPRFLAKVDKKRQVPSLAVLSSLAIGVVCIILGDTSQLVTASALGACGMYVLSMLSFFQLRKSQPMLNRPYQTPLYPYLPAMALILGLFAFFAVFVSAIPIAMYMFLGFLVCLVLFCLNGRMQK
ncbi:ethanolamine permease [Leptospira ryugenii]|uniref:Ethanolamine permease n=1 Tax=Leptospira ryugenii TaxID=1917863 RepID=A0A2P2E4B7_9LEPT|nr:ethanolamine permease [Leptospira ryugenii]GBF51725.1 ethanolamine permease [Leptospira ryugenii]